jgi:hypothetical protein
LTGFVISVSYFRSRTFVYWASDKVGNELIIMRDGVANIHLYYVPKPYITNYDGSSLWIDVPSGLVGPKFERQEEPTQEEIDMLMNEVPD